MLNVLGGNRVGRQEDGGRPDDTEDNLAENWYEYQVHGVR